MKSRIKQILLLVTFFTSFVYTQTTKIITLNYQTEKTVFGLTKKVSKISPSVGFALSGGGARGLAQIGVLKALLEEGINPDIIVGTSMGSIVGGLLAAGYSIEQLDSIAINTNWQNLLAFERQSNRKDLFVDQKVTEDKAIFTLRLKGLKPVIPTALNGGMKIMNFLNLAVLQAPIHVKSSFDGLKIKFNAVCTNLLTGKPIILDNGSLSQAMRASSSVSFFLSPVQLDSMTLVDGGLVANIPVKIAKDKGSDFVIALNTTSGLHDQNELQYPWIVADQVISIPMKILNEEQLNLADIVISPKLNNHNAADFTNIDSLIYEGYKQAKLFVKKIKLQLDSAETKKIRESEYWIKNVKLNKDNSGQGKEYLINYSLNDSVSNYQIKKDLNKLFKTGNYSNVSAKITLFDKYSTIDFDLEKYPEIKKIEIDGTNLFQKSYLEKLFDQIIGKPYNVKTIESTLITLINKYRKEGYSLAEISTISFEDTTGLLKILINEGKLAGIIVEGNNKTKKEIITREFSGIGQKYFSYSKIEQGLINLRSTNLFDDIILGLKSENGFNYLDIKVKEKISSLVRFGFRVDNENKAQFSVDLRDENIFGTGTELGLLLFGGTRKRAFVLEHKSNRVFDTYLTYNVNAFYKLDDILSYGDDQLTNDSKFSRSINGEYRETHYGASVSVGTQVEKFGNLIFTGKYEVNEAKNLTGQQISPLKLKLASFKIGSTIDTQDKYPYPQKGVYLNAYYETGQTIFGGDIGYTKFSFFYKNYITLGGTHTLIPKLELGFGDKTLPITQQFSLGGQNSFFGMHDYEYRGRQLFLASLEYRYKIPFDIFFNTYLKFRYDLGSTWEFPEQIRFKDFKHGIGATVSFNTPIGPADFSVGKSFKLKRNLTNSTISWGDVLFYFSIGYYF